MSHEISQLEISGIQLRDSKTQPKVSHSREIGEAQIVHNIFGKAKVRIIRKYDNVWRSLWLVSSFAAAVTATYLVQNWLAARQTETITFAVPATVRPDVQASAAPVAAEKSVASSAPAVAVAQPARALPAEAAKPVLPQKSVVPQQQVPVNPATKEVTRPVVVAPKPLTPPPVMPQPAALQPGVEGKPQMPAPVAGGTAAKPQAIPPIAARPVVPKQPAVPAAAAAPAAKIVAPASAPVVAPVQGQPAREDKSAAPAVEKPLSSPVEPGNRPSPAPRPGE